jgi:Mannose-6-phosphate isomerase
MEEGLPREISKPWGSELWFAHTESYAGKILRVNAGARLSIQYHEEKDETSFVLSGRVIVSQGDSTENLTSRELGPGESWRNRPLVSTRSKASKTPRSSRSPRHSLKTLFGWAIGMDGCLERCVTGGSRR